MVSYDYCGGLVDNINPTPVTQKSFSTDVMPILQTCTGCYESSSNYTVTTASGTYTNITSNGFINTTTTSNSKLLLKATNTTSHGGGTRFKTSSTQYQTLLTWITQGAKNN